MSYPPISILLLGTVIWLTACTAKDIRPDPEGTAGGWWTDASEDQLLDSVQIQALRYFWDFAEPNSGLARERFHPDGDYPADDAQIITTGGTGFGVMSILAGIERGFIHRQEGMERLSKIVNFLENADRYHGIWSHWIDGRSGRTQPFSPKDDGGDLVESAFLIQGLLCVRQYCRPEVPSERSLAERIDRLWRDMEWDWYTKNEDALYWHWSPRYEWAINFALEGYNETLITYILAASSPTHAITTAPYHQTWARKGDIVATDQYYGYDRVLDHYPGGGPPVGPLFWAHYSYLGLDPRGLTDQYADYWTLNRNHSLIHYQHCQENPNNYQGYGPDLWGLTASYTRNEDGSIGYAAHHPTEDKGVISPTAAISSIPYTPEQSLAAIRGFYRYGEQLLGPAGFYDAFSPEYDWVANRYLAIDQGPIVVMIENYRSGLLWDLFMSCPEVQTGLRRLGFQSPQID